MHQPVHGPYGVVITQTSTPTRARTADAETRPYMPAPFNYYIITYTIVHSMYTIGTTQQPSTGDSQTNHNSPQLCVLVSHKAEQCMVAMSQLLFDSLLMSS